MQILYLSDKPANGFNYPPMRMARIESFRNCRQSIERERGGVTLWGVLFVARIKRMFRNIFYMGLCGGSRQTPENRGRTMKINVGP